MPDETPSPTDRAYEALAAADANNDKKLSAAEILDAFNAEVEAKAQAAIESILAQNSKIVTYPDGADNGESPEFMESPPVITVEDIDIFTEFDVITAISAREGIDPDSVVQAMQQVFGGNVENVRLSFLCEGSDYCAKSPLTSGRVDISPKGKQFA